MNGQRRPTIQPMVLSTPTLKNVVEGEAASAFDPDAGFAEGLAEGAGFGPLVRAEDNDYATYM